MTQGDSSGRNLSGWPAPLLERVLRTQASCVLELEEEVQVLLCRGDRAVSSSLRYELG